MTQRLLLITPVHNEQAHIELVADAVAAQTRRPDLWVIVDDESTDRTPELLAEIADRYEFVTIRNTRELPRIGKVDDRLATAAEARAFNLGLRSVDWESFTHISKLDGDTELPTGYFERILGEFERDAQLGLAGGMYADPAPDGGWKLVRVPSGYHVPGTLKCYSRECFEAIGGMREQLGWDIIDETYARMRGYRTRSYEDLVVHHHRPAGSADGTLRGRARHGLGLYMTHFPPGWVTVRAIFRMGRARPRVIGGVAFLYGYVRAAVTRAPRVEDQEFRRFVRRELRERMLGALRSRLPARAGGRNEASPSLST
jgi:glycosyltransferase involved in cell wall biosynthesis